MTIKEVTRRPFELSEYTESKMDEKRQMIREGKTDTDLKDIRREVSKSIRKDKRQHNLQLVDKELGIRDQFMGLRYLRSAFTPVPLGMKDATGKHIPFAQRADKAAGSLGTKI